ncbi:MAG: MFS transporter [Clostridia bacterium]|nr:MFS transporter [Clostridia bacterium]MDD4386962.1 MFS transporter [Clostridia bacterium]
MNRNEKIYPIYRMFGYDYLFYMVISFLFFTITKGISVGQIMYLSAFAAIFISIFQVPTNYIVEKIGLKKSMIIGNLFWITHMVIIMVGTSFTVFVIAEAICALGTCLKTLSETQLLYASLKKTNNRKNFAKIEGKGVSWYYYFEALSTLFVGSLFQINNYLPMVCTLTFGIITFVISMFFDDIKDYMTEKSSITQYLKGFKLVLKSKRIISIFLFSFIMAGLIRVTDIIQKSTIVDLQVSAVEYSLIFAVLTFCIGIGSSIQYRIENVFKRKTLTFIGYSFAILILILGVFNIILLDKNLVLIISIAILIMRNLLSGIYRISVKKYMNNFTTHNVRGKILSVFYIFENVGSAILFFTCGSIIDNTGTNNTSIILGVFSIGIIFLVAKFMNNRLGLNAEEYSKDDIFGIDVEKEK